MNWTRVILDGLAMTVVFNAVVGLFWFLMPHAYTRMLPKDIQAAAGPQTKSELARLAAVLYPLFIGITAWIILSARCTGVTGFWNLFWTGYVEMLFVNFGDFLILDCWLRGIVKDKRMLPGTETCKSWEFQGWMRSAVPEHFLFWPIVVCTLVGLLCAWLGA